MRFGLAVALYGAIGKVTKQEDGTLEVEGVASSEALDADGEVITAGAMKAALPDYMKFGAVREMHGKVAAGTAIAADVVDGVTTFTAHVVDPIACKKVETGVYKGFSIGGKVLKRDPADRSRITALKLTEISLVDRPANPDAVFSLYKAERPSLNKDMGLVSWAARLLGELASLSACVSEEARWEGDGSHVPALLQETVEDFTNAIKEMLDEESAELVAAAQAQLAGLAADAAEGIAMNEKMEKAAADLQKAADLLGANIEKSEARVARIAELEAALAKSDARVAELEGDLVKAEGLMTRANDELGELVKAAGGKAGVVLRAVAKSDDGASIGAAGEEAEPKDAVGMLRKLHAAGGRSIVPK